MSDPIKDYLSKIGRKGGRASAAKGGMVERGGKGGKDGTPRSELARRAAQARWAKQKAKADPGR
jgi:hypothetical protein